MKVRLKYLGVYFSNDIKGQDDKNDIGTKKRLEVNLINGWILN